MDMFDEARALRTMIAMRTSTQREIADKLGVSQSYVANKLRLLSFSDAVQSRIRESGISERHARALLRLSTESDVFLAIDKILAMHLSVAATEALVDVMLIEDKLHSLPKAEVHERLAKFDSFLDESVVWLTSAGMKVRKSTDYVGNKRYITLSIEE